MWGVHTRVSPYFHNRFGVSPGGLSYLLGVSLEEIQLQLDTLQADGLVKREEGVLGVDYAVTAEGALLALELEPTETIQDILLHMAMQVGEHHLPYYLQMDVSEAALDAWLRASDRDLRHIHPDRLRALLSQAEEANLVDANQSEELYSRWQQRSRVIFLCYSSSDRTRIRDLYQRLLKDGMNPWFDEVDLLPGQNWEEEIERALQKSDVVVVCLSRNSVSKTGFVQKEIKLALDAADLRPPGTIFIIPARLEECEVPERLMHLQWVNLFEKGGHKKLLAALNKVGIAKTLPDRRS